MVYYIQCKLRRAGHVSAPPNKKGGLHRHSVVKDRLADLGSRFGGEVVAHAVSFIVATSAKQKDDQKSGHKSDKQSNEFDEGFHSFYLLFFWCINYSI